jgi:hypothetical protein
MTLQVHWTGADDVENQSTAKRAGLRARGSPSPERAFGAGVLPTRGINAYSLYGWRSRLRAGGARKEPAVSRPARAEPTAEFTELGALGRNRSRCEVRLDLGGGVMLHLVRS